MPSKTKEVKTVKRGRGRPSKQEQIAREHLAGLLTAVNFIQSLGDEVSEAWLEKNGYETRAELQERRKLETEQERERLEQEIEERKAELRALEGQG